MLITGNFQPAGSFKHVADCTNSLVRSLIRSLTYNTEHTRARASLHTVQVSVCISSHFRVFGFGVLSSSFAKAARTKCRILNVYAVIDRLYVRAIYNNIRVCIHFPFLRLIVFRFCMHESYRLCAPLAILYIQKNK